MTHGSSWGSPRRWRGPGTPLRKAFGLFVKLPLTVGLGAAIRMRRTIRAATRRTVNSLATKTYFSRGAVLWGDAGPVYYLLRPAQGTAPALAPDREDPDFLHREIAGRLARTEVVFDLCVQRFVDERRTSVEDASVEWKPEIAPVVPVARLTVPRQDVDEAAARAAAERVDALAPLGAASVIAAHGKAAFGYAEGAFGAGCVLGGLVALRIRPSRPLFGGGLAMFLFPLMPLAAALVPALPLLMLGYGVSGIGWAFWGVQWATAVQTQIPQDRLGRVAAYEVAGSILAVPLGQTLSGPAGTAFGVRPPLLVAAVVGLGCAAALIAVAPIRRLRLSPGAGVTGRFQGQPERRGAAEECS
ncbi:hypothetical protein [Streptomyces sp. NPDC002573]|uniref:hypothetical protein n=1 Tax=Streptomyces sp. NPDC002573 TaxID=3364651 RepID=UPI00367EC782